MTVPRWLTVAAVLVAMAAALFLVAGPPDLHRSLHLLDGSEVSGPTELAFVSLLCWVVLVALALATVAAALRRGGVLSRSGTQRKRSVALLAAGAALLVAGVVHHQAGYRVCCSNAATIQLAQSHVR